MGLSFLFWLSLCSQLLELGLNPLLMMGSNNDTSAAAAAAAAFAAAAAVAKKAKDAEKAKADKERSEKIQKWVDSMTMDDVVWDDEAKWILIVSEANNQKTHLQSIKGTAPALYMVPALQKFCVKHQMMVAIRIWTSMEYVSLLLELKSPRICKMTCI
jgi:hypothetical protein